MGSRSLRFIDLARWRRRRAYLRARAEIAREPEGLGVFKTPIVLPGTAEWRQSEARYGYAGELGHARCTFLSVARAHAGWVYHGDFCSIPVHAAVRLSDWVDAEVERSAALENGSPFRTNRWQEEARVWERLRDPSLWPELRIGCSRSFRCPRAVDLFFVCDVPVFTPGALADVIRAFWGSGEVVEETRLDPAPWYSLIQEDIERSIVACHRMAHASS